MQLYERLIAWLLHVANTDAHCSPSRFYGVKEKLLRRYGRFAGHELQEIRKECWGPRVRGDWYDDSFSGCKGASCSRCGGTGLFDIRWIRLERWEWRGYVFHRPAGDTRVKPDITHVRIFGRIRHKDYGIAAGEARLWLYLLTCEWRLFWHDLSTHCYGYPRWWPLLNLQRVAMNARMWLEVRRCFCGRKFLAMNTGWQICRKCRKPHETAIDRCEIPF